MAKTTTNTLKPATLLLVQHVKTSHGHGLEVDRALSFAFPFHQIVMNLKKNCIQQIFLLIDFLPY